MNWKISMMVIIILYILLKVKTISVIINDEVPHSFGCVAFSRRLVIHYSHYSDKLKKDRVVNKM